MQLSHINYWAVALPLCWRDTPLQLFVTYIHNITTLDLHIHLISCADKSYFFYFYIFRVDIHEVARAQRDLNGFNFKCN